MSETKSEPKKSNQLNPSRLKGSEFAHNIWVVNAEQGTEREDLKNPNFWAHVAQNMRTNDEIKVFAEDGSFYAHYLVLAADRTWVRVFELTFVELTEQEVSAGLYTDYEVKLRGPRRWSVIRKSDRAILQENLHTESDARNWLDGYLKNPMAA